MERDSLKIANDSGFPLQIALQHTVDATTARHGWSVRFAENSWRNESDGLSGFTDLTLKHGDDINLLIECKRVRGARWVFMCPEGIEEENAESNAWFTHYDRGQTVALGWKQVQNLPSSPICFFCAIVGQTSNDRSTLIERTAAELISAAEALALEDLNRRDPTSEIYRFYLNAIVTTARIELATFSPTNISLEDGTISRGDVREVPFVRFRKQLSTRANAVACLDDRTTAFTKENTVFVIQAKHLTDFLTDFDFLLSNYRGHGGE
jgi:hypothetical protein